MAGIISNLKDKVCGSNTPYKAIFPEYHYSGVIDTNKQVKAYEEGGYFHLEVKKVQDPAQSNSTDGNLEKIIYHAKPKSDNENDSDNEQKAYDPKVVMVDFMKGGNLITKLTSTSNNPRVHETLKSAQTKFDDYLKQIYEAKTKDLV